MKTTVGSIQSFLLDALQINQVRLSRLTGTSEQTLIKWKGLRLDDTRKRRGIKKLLLFVELVLYFKGKGLGAQVIRELLQNPFYKLISGEIISLVSAIRDHGLDENFVLLLAERKYNEFMASQKEFVKETKQKLKLAS